MLAAMRSRAPDGDQDHCDGAAAIGQAFLRTGASAAEAMNALTLDGRVWLVADARLDGRPELLRALRVEGRTPRADSPDGELLLHAYAAFGERMVDHLVGDFAFVIWDAPRQRLLCVRDHFGIRPLYYARVAERFYFASDIDALLANPEVPRELDDRAVAEFLLLGVTMDPGRTIYKEIRALEPAGAMVLSGEGVRTWQWWRLERGPDQRYPRREDYAERFREVFRQAVLDRMPAGPVALQLSAGMDSSSIAAVAATAARGAGYTATAYHHTTQSVIPEDDELGLARQIAQCLHIPLVAQDLASSPLFARRLEPALHMAQPLTMPHPAVHRDVLDSMQRSGARVLLSGYMGDATLSAHQTYYSDLVRRGHLGKFAREVTHHLLSSWSVRGLGLRTLHRRAARSPAWKPALPDWIEPEVVESQDLDELWRRWWYLHENAVDGLDQLRLPWIEQQFRATEIFAAPVVGRYPFMDIRLIKFAAGLPNFLLLHKRILREAMRAELPAAVIARPKLGAHGDVLRAMVTNGNMAADSTELRLPPGVSAHKFQRAMSRFRNGEGADSTWASWLLMQVFALGYWLADNEIAT
jgi:asparagine synthase (glutamine-hydrolysing)